MFECFRKIIGMGVIFVLVWTLSIPAAYALELEVSENGSGSVNQVVVASDSQTKVEQSNVSEVANSVDTENNTGENTADGNSTGGVLIATGDSSSQVEIENSGNISTAEIGCCPTGNSALITQNGSGSTNNIDVSSSSTTFVSSNQYANISNNIKGTATTGSNSASFNTGGTTTIITGNIGVRVNLENSPVNVNSLSIKSGNPSLSTKLAGNGVNSLNNISENFLTDTAVYVNSLGNIYNNLFFDLLSGGNKADGGSGGDVKILTGDIDLQVFINNFANIGGVEIDCCEIFDPGEEDKID